MMEWKKVRLGTLCSMNSGGTPSRSKPEYYTGSIPWAKISDIESGNDGIVHNTEEHITKEGLASINNRIFPKGILLLAMYGSVGKIAFTGVEMSTNQAILGIKIIDESKLNYAYLKHWFTRIKEQLLNRAVGGTLQNISLGIVKELEIPLPPLEKQQQIAHILDKADALRRKDRELLQQYDALAQAIFIELFGDPVRNERGWHIKKLGEVLNTFKYGTNEKSGDYSDGYSPVLRIPNIIGDEIIVSNLKYSLLVEKEKQQTLLQKGDLLFVRSNGNPNYIGRSAVFNLEGAYSYASYLIRGRMKTPSLPFSTYIQFAMSHESYRPIILKKATTTAGNYNINTESLKNLSICVPDNAVLITFHNVLANIMEQKKIILKNNYSETLFQSLLQGAFSGRL